MAKIKSLTDLGAMSRAPMRVRDCNLCRCERMDAGEDRVMKLCKTNPFAAQLAKRGGALRFCAMRRVARAEWKI